MLLLLSLTIMTNSMMLLKEGQQSRKQAEKKKRRNMRQRMLMMRSLSISLKKKRRILTMTTMTMRMESSVQFWSSESCSRAVCPRLYRCCFGFLLLEKHSEVPSVNLVHHPLAGVAVPLHVHLRGRRYQMHSLRVLSPTALLCLLLFQQLQDYHRHS